MFSNFSNSFIIITNFNAFIFNVFYYLKNPTFPLPLSSSLLLRLSSMFFNLCKIPPFFVLSFLFNPSLKNLPKGEYANFGCSSASGLYFKSCLVKNSY